MEVMIKLINDYIKYIVSSEEPLSSNVFFINGKSNTYIYDVGRNEEAYKELVNSKPIKQFSKTVNQLNKASCCNI